MGNNNTAKSGSDFVTPKSDAYLLLPNGSSSGIITIEILPDDLPEFDEMFQVRYTLINILIIRYTAGI